MSSEELRQAAALMRERALKAIPSPWVAEPLGSEGYAIFGPGINPNAASVRLRVRRWVARIGMNDWSVDKDTAKHIASWHPAVALAVADWLESEAQAHFHFGDEVRSVYDQPNMGGPALAVARAYLGTAR